MQTVLLALALCVSWSDRVAIADAVVAARIAALPELPDTYAPKPGAPPPVSPPTSVPKQAGYPIRPPGTRWTGLPRDHAGAVRHLTTGRHAGQFDPAWLVSLTWDQLDSLHTDAHEGQFRGVPVFLRQSPTPVPPPSLGPVLPVSHATRRVRDADPEIAVTLFVTHPCGPCEAMWKEIKTGEGRRKIQWRVQDYGAAGPFPRLEWVANGRARFHSGFIKRAELEALIRRTEAGE